MKVKTANKCWACGKNTIISFEELGHGWQKCSSCGATHLPNPTRLEAGTVVIEKVTKGYHDTKYRPRKRRMPTASARVVSGKE